LKKQQKKQKKATPETV